MLIRTSRKRAAPCKGVKCMLNDRGIAVIYAASSAGVMVSILALVHLFPFSSSDELKAAIAAFFVSWFVALILGTFLMIFLGPIFEILTRRTSLLLFLFAGFALTFGLGYFASSIGARGEPSSLESDWYAAMKLIITYSLIGATSAYMAWRSLRKRSTNGST